jgi:hypothetical protein
MDTEQLFFTICNWLNQQAHKITNNQLMLFSSQFSSTPATLMATAAPAIMIEPARFELVVAAWTITVRDASKHFVFVFVGQPSFTYNRCNKSFLSRYGEGQQSLIERTLAAIARRWDAGCPGNITQPPLSQIHNTNQP